MEDYTTWHSDRLYSMLRILRLSHAPEDAKWYALIAAELDRRCQIFSWVDDLLHIEPKNPFVTMHQGIMAFAGENRAWPNIFSYPISNPAEFSALLQYFISKPRT